MQGLGSVWKAWGPPWAGERCPGLVEGDLRREGGAGALGGDLIRSTPNPCSVSSIPAQSSWLPWARPPPTLSRNGRRLSSESESLTLPGLAASRAPVLARLRGSPSPPLSSVFPLVDLQTLQVRGSPDNTRVEKQYVFSSHGTPFSDGCPPPPARPRPSHLNHLLSFHPLSPQPGC